MIKEITVPLFDMVMCLSDSLDLISQDVINHHKRVAYIAFSLGAELGLSREEQNELLLAGALHDIGAFSLRERLDALEFELGDPHRPSRTGYSLHRHAQIGYLLLKGFEPFFHVANIVRYHHVPWDGEEEFGEKIPLESHLLHLADRIDVLIDKRKEILDQSEIIVEKIDQKSGTMFAPHLVEAFKNLASKEFFWFELTSRSPDSILLGRSRLGDVELDLDGLLDFSRFLAQIVDMRCRFTATHSWGVAIVSQILGQFMGLSEKEGKMLKIAGYLHDLGKLAVPQEIIDQPGALSQSQYNIIKSHAFYTYNILENIEDLEPINFWASFHHERLDGSGYPFHHRGEDLTLGARIVAVADVFTAIAEARPYREGMDKSRALETLDRMARNGALDINVVSVLRRNYDAINSARTATQKEAILTSQRLWEEIEKWERARK
jgi:HD-GYP domain-containing protein (c-di-GMP phosphodiesterase class II)